MTKEQLLAALDEAMKDRMGVLFGSLHDKIIMANGRSTDEASKEFNRGFVALQVAYGLARTMVGV